MTKTDRSRNREIVNYQKDQFIALGEKLEHINEEIERPETIDEKNLELLVQWFWTFLTCPALLLTNNGGRDFDPMPEENPEGWEHTVYCLYGSYCLRVSYYILSKKYRISISTGEEKVLYFIRATEEDMYHRVLSIERIKKARTFNVKDFYMSFLQGVVDQIPRI